MVTALSGFIEQVGSMIEEIPKHNYYPHIPQRDSTDTCLQANLYGCYQIQNQIIQCKNFPFTL